MRKTISAILLLAIMATSASANMLDRKPKKKKRKKTEQVENNVKETAPVVPVPAAPAVPVVEEVKVVKEPVTDLTLGFTPSQVDSLVAEWKESLRAEDYENFFDTYIRFDSIDSGLDMPDSLYIKRLRAMASPIQLPFNNIVKGRINRYVNPRYGTMSRILGRSVYYFPLIEEELIKAGLPVELRALPIIESALVPTAVSRAGAVGLWQFMPFTGRSYGLEINTLVDERRDPIRSTKAACRFLKDLYSIYKDWSLAIAAYNCGPGNVNKAIARAGEKSKTFWDIYDYLPRETRDYVPAFIGASYAYAYHHQHDIEPTPLPISVAVDTIQVNRIMHFEQIASTIDVSMDMLRQLNPQYKLDILPATTKSYTLVLPQRAITDYIAHEQEIFAKDSTYLKEYINPANLDKKRHERVNKIHTVKRGETLGGIARRYRVTTTQLMRWNGIKNAHRLRIGQRLRIEK